MFSNARSGTVLGYIDLLQEYACYCSSEGEARVENKRLNVNGPIFHRLIMVSRYHEYGEKLEVKCLQGLEARGYLKNIR